MKLNSNPALYGLIGYPVKHSLSPLMHNAAFKALKINARYTLFEINPEELEPFLLYNKEVKDIEGSYFSIEDLSGFNITIPHKIRAKEILEGKFSSDTHRAKEILEDYYYVKLSGAINTVKREDGILQYLNTDAAGFLRSLEQDLRFDPKGKNALIIGCGGAGRAIIAALSWINTGIKKIYVNDISGEVINSAKRHFLQSALPQSEHLQDVLEFIPREQIPKAITGCHLLVNASALGMKEEDLSVIDKNLLREDLFVYDVVYNRETRLIKDAKERGLKHARGGRGMLLYQGVAAFELWTKQKAPVEVMARALEKGLRQCQSK